MHEAVAKSLTVSLVGFAYYGNEVNAVAFFYLAD